MIVSGPLTPALGVDLIVTDPDVTTPLSVSVQVQNNSGFTLITQIGGVPYCLPPYAATTIPTRQDPQFVARPSGAVGTATGPVTLSWLQPQDTAPIPDGPLVGATKII